MNGFNFRSKQAGGLTRYKHMQTIKKQRGAIAIEFAALFTIFFVIVYAIIAYSIPLLLTTTFKQVSSDAGRAAVRVDLALIPPKYKQEDSEYAQKVSEEVTKAVEKSWLPASWVDGNCPTPKPKPKAKAKAKAEGEGEGETWTPLPEFNGKPSYGFLKLDTVSKRYTLQVCLQRKYGSTGPASERAIIPTINMLGIKIPSLPKAGGETVIRSYTTVRL